MKVTEAIQKRHSVRQFTTEKIPLATLKDIIKAAQLAPSWVNSQPYQVHLLIGDALEAVRQAQGELEHKGVQGNPDVPVMSRKDWAPQAQQNMAEWTHGLGDAGQLMGPAAAELYQAQAVIYLTLPTGYSPWSLYDLGAFGDNLILEATAHGWGSMTAYQLIKYPQLLRQQLQIPTDQQIIIGIALGREATDAPINRLIKAKRMPLESILTVHDQL